MLYLKDPKPFLTLKELERMDPKNGVVPQSVKDVGGGWVGVQ